MEVTHQSSCVKELECDNPLVFGDLIPRHAKQGQDWLEHLEQHGWAVATIDGWKAEFTDMFLSWLEGCCGKFKKDDVDTWIPENLPMMVQGIIRHYFGHTELMWNIRELCIPIFTRIWNCKPEDLLCSFDGGCFLPGTSVKSPNETFKHWFHTDSPRSMTFRSSIQGIVNFAENGPEDGGLVLFEGSRDVFPEYMERHPTEGIKWGLSDISDPALASRPILKICAPPGSIILFDGRMFHCNCPVIGSKYRDDNTPRFRMAAYICMQPRSAASPKELEKRVKLYESGRMTGHWCYGPYFTANSENPRTNTDNKPITVEIASLNPLRRRLVGYNE